MNHRMQAIFLAAALMASASTAQEPSHAPDGGTSTRVSGVELLAIPGVPLTGKSSTVWTRTLPDGTSLTTHLETNLARDSQGRMYRERRRFVPANSNLTPRLEEIHIYDPVAGTKTTCTVATHECIITNYRPLPQKAFPLQPVGSFDNGTRYLERVNLGTNVMGGLDVIGTRETVTIVPGAIGNNRAIASTREFWYSDALKTNLLVTRTDPIEGTQEVRLIDFSTAEPDPRLFDPPSGYSIRDARTAVQSER
jgi:hypothetical protein